MTLKLSIQPNVHGGEVTTYQVFARLERDGAEPVDFGGNLDGSATFSKEELRGLCAALLDNPPVQVVVDGDVAAFSAAGVRVPMRRCAAQGVVGAVLDGELVRLSGGGNRR